VALVSVSLLLMPREVRATHSSEPGPPQDFVTGGGHHSVPDTQFTISARSGPLGEDPQGQFSFKIEDQPRIRAEVTCLIVVGNEAFATGVMVSPSSAEGQLVVMHAVDGGEPAPGQAAGPDLLRFSFEGFIVEDPQNPGCFLPVLPPVPVTQGNIVVHDSTP
jgi:hypothetical protein